MLKDRILDIFCTTLKEFPVAIQTFVFRVRTPIFTVDYLADNFIENFDVLKSKF